MYRTNYSMENRLALYGAQCATRCERRDMDAVEESRRLFRDLVERFTHPGRTCTPYDLDVVFRLCKSLLHISDQKASTMIRKNSMRPLLSVYMNDGWGGGRYKHSLHGATRRTRHSSGRPATA